VLIEGVDVRSCARVCMRLRMRTLISVNIMLLILAMLPSLSIMHSLSDCAVVLKTGSTTHCSTIHDLSTILSENGTTYIIHH
jgi:hypothetical protein